MEKAPATISTLGIPFNQIVFIIGPGLSCIPLACRLATQLLQLGGDDVLAADCRRVESPSVASSKMALLCRLLSYSLTSRRKQRTLIDRALGGSAAHGRPAIEGAAGKRALLAILKTVWLYSLALWAYAAAVAVASPGRVSERLLLMGNLPRTDTSGIIAFGASALSFAILGSLRRVNRPDQPPVYRVVDSVLRTIALYAFLGWIYIAANAIEDPSTLPLRLTHLSTRPTESQFGAIGFVLSGLAACAFWARQQPARSKHAANEADQERTQRSA